MRFAVTQERQDFAQSLDQLLSGQDVPAVARRWAADDVAPGLALWDRLAESGVTALLVPEDDGGMGGDARDLVVAMRELGRHAVPGPWVDTVALAPLVLAATGVGADWCAEIAAGRLRVAVATAQNGGRVGDARGADLVLRVGAHLARARTTDVHGSLDPTRAPADVEDVELLSALSPADLARATDHAALAAAAQSLGAGERMLEISVDYVKVRTQFGRPVGEYQAVKHLLADVKVALEFAAPLVHGAALALAGGDVDAPRLVSAAKVAATDAAVLSARTALQVHGAVGYTLEHDLSLWFGKAHALAGTWGTRRQHRERIMESLVTAR